MKGCCLELAQRNSQASIPFALSNRGYGFLWNNPAIGRVTFANNLTEWIAECSEHMDLWITAGDTPAEIEEAYAEATGKVPMMPDYATGFWQCKLRYTTQEQLLNVAREYKKRVIPISVIVCDFTFGATSFLSPVSESITAVTNLGVINLPPLPMLATAVIN